MDILANACSESVESNSSGNERYKIKGNEADLDEESTCQEFAAVETEENGVSSGAESLASVRITCRGNWTMEEDEKLRKAVAEFGGRNWKKIAEQIRDRTDVQCLHRWQKVLRPGLIKGMIEINIYNFVVTNNFHLIISHCMNRPLDPGSK